MGLKNLDASIVDSQIPIADKLSRGNIMASACPSRKILKHLTSQWGVLVLVTLLGGTHRFGALRKKIDGVSERMLVQTLQSLESDGMLLRQDFSTNSPHVEYTLTELGITAAEKIQSLVDWIECNVNVIVDVKEKGTSDN
ncbi:winged helix-turn-helix transcriptional regulator [Pseudomonas sp. Marseille-Q5117]|uniref:winged helix-turn-helix transcriptional regulator n=1 Tax=Pseudomonas sp. Marseille-Q5117 TaxID=2972777 RepID=UPI0021C904D8|nr:helix-turn-helix domain-containing protein [Pseudomonas sp. Marseille-Q5117]